MVLTVKLGLDDFIARLRARLHETGDSAHAV
jgi:hypothetical protein